MAKWANVMAPENEYLLDESAAALKSTTKMWICGARPRARDRATNNRTKMLAFLCLTLLLRRHII